ncbi:MAG: hypothetical protein AB1765_07675 [Candidatus Hydrogenedentota bacterium]
MKSMSKPLTALTESDLWKEVKVEEDDICGDLKPQHLEMLKKTLEATISTDITRYLCAGRYARDENRVDYRCGGMSIEKLCK